MCARQVDQLESTGIDIQLSNMPFNRDAGVIADSLPQTGQPVEQGALAGIGIADHRDAGIVLPGDGDLIGGNADFCRFTQWPRLMSPRMRLPVHAAWRCPARTA